MKNFIKIENGSDITAVNIDDIIAMNVYITNEDAAELSVWIKGSEECLVFNGKYDEMKILYDKIENAMSNYYNVFSLDTLCKNITEEKPPKIAKRLPDLDKCVLITED